MDSAELLVTLRTLSHIGTAEVLKKLSDFNLHNQYWFGTPAPQGIDYSELVGVIFRLIGETSKPRKCSNDSDDIEEIANVELLKELCRCLKILSREKEYALAISKVDSCFPTLLLYGNITGDGNLENYQGFDIPSVNPDHQISLLMQETQIEILKVICNSIFHSKDSRSIYKKNCCSKYVTDRIGQLSMADHYDNCITSVLVKILFIMSALDMEERDNMRFFYNTSHVLLKLLEKSLQRIFDSISERFVSVILYFGM